ncbi:hypothetical protein Q669_08845 [Labrenzia sp. C1B10]|nr:hypothetical protein Q669_08845 [Labrenzia sp. C1B10]ERP99500.1 hypothetical protein Q675_13070 [Labrenzia sp. C1B70]
MTTATGWTPTYASLITTHRPQDCSTGKVSFPVLFVFSRHKKTTGFPVAFNVFQFGSEPYMFG